MQQLGRIAVSAMMLVFSIACSDSGGGSGGGTASASARCPGICSVGQQQCGWSDGDKQDCDAGCGSVFQSYPAACQSQADAVFSCASEPSVWDCTGGEPDGCKGALDTFEACTNQHSNVDMAAYCSKCQSCYADDPSFDEGFCGDFWDGSTFNYAGCVANGDVSQIDDKSLTSANLNGMSCADFDSRI